MTFKEQLNKIKNNWFLILIVVVLLLLFFGSSFLGNLNLTKSSVRYSEQVDRAQQGYFPDMMTDSYDYTPSPSAGQSSSQEPTIDDIQRRIIKNANLRTEIKGGTFFTVDSRIKSIANTTDSFILNENVTTSRVGSKLAYRGVYTINVDSDKIDGIVDQLKEIGNITSINYGSSDVTDRYTNTEIEIEIEKRKLERYEEIYAGITNPDQQMRWVNTIFNQERRIKYLEDSLKNIDRKVEYSTITFTVQEKYSYGSIVLVKFSELLKTFIGSLNTVLIIIFAVIPFLFFGYLIFLSVRFIRRKRNKDESLKKIKK